MAILDRTETRSDGRSKASVLRQSMSHLPSLAGKVAVVTGASDGIGKAIAISLGKAGIKVAVGARRKDALDVTVKEIENAGGTAIAVQTDVVSREQVKNMIAETEKTFGPVDILVNNAAIYYITFMKSLKEDEWEKTIDVNCKGTMNCIGAVLAGMVERKRGHIINISSDSGRWASPGLAVYTGTKFFIEGMSQALRAEVAGVGVKVTTIQPGWVDTPGIKQDFESEATAKFNNSSELKIMSAEDIANAVLYAVSQPDHVAVNELLIQPTTQSAI